ncbi:MAG: hypothetical protein IJF33_06805 [Clostridia bacterium]|nr:hypothetical protein [Clostridia bacterium]
MADFFDSVFSVAVTLIFAVFLIFLAALSIRAILDCIPRSRRKVDQENEELREQHRKDWEQMQELEKTQKKGEALYKATCDQLREKFSEDIPKMLDSVITGRLNNAFDSNLSIKEFSAQIPSSDSSETYTVTLTSCTCKDRGTRHAPCKHMLYLAYTLGVLQLNQSETQDKYWVSVQRVNEKAKERKELEAEIKKLKRKIESLNQTVEKKKRPPKQPLK